MHSNLCTCVLNAGDTFICPSAFCKIASVHSMYIYAKFSALIPVINDFIFPPHLGHLHPTPPPSPAPKNKNSKLPILYSIPS